MPSPSQRYPRFAERYDAGDVPWDHADPPPEVLELVPTLPAGRALDLGCGYGRAALFMARLGWTVDGVDFVARAIEIARERAVVAGLAGRVQYHHGDVADLSFLTGTFDFALDVGTFHSLDRGALEAYASGLARLLRPGAPYLVFVHLGPAAPDETDGPPWVGEATLVDLFADGFTLDHAEHGVTEIAGRPPRPSAWFWYRRALS